MTVEDRNEFRTIVKEEIGQALESAKAHTDASIQVALESSKAHTDVSIGALRDELTEKMRDMQTEMLRGLEKLLVAISAASTPSKPLRPTSTPGWACSKN